MLVDVVAGYSLREKIHAKLHGYKLPPTPVRVSQGCYLVKSYSDVDCLIMQVFAQTQRPSNLVVDGKCVSFLDVEAEYNFLASDDKEFFIVFWSSGFGPKLLKAYQDDGLVIGDISKAHKSVYNLLGISGESTILYDYSVFRLEDLK